MPNVVTTSECGYAFCLTFCHSANKNCYAQIISGYIPDNVKNFSEKKLNWLNSHEIQKEGLKIKWNVFKIKCFHFAVAWL